MTPRIVEGVCYAIPPTEYLAWQTLFRVIVRAREYGILAAMDAAYRGELNLLLADLRERRMKQAADEARNRTKG
jgi:hypothetical protein